MGLLRRNNAWITVPLSKPEKIMELIVISGIGVLVLLAASVPVGGS